MSKIVLDDGKYTVTHRNGANLKALRYGAEWRDLTGDGLVLALVQRIEQLEEVLERISEDGEGNWRAMLAKATLYPESIQQQETSNPETLPLMARETFEKLFINASGNTPPTCSVNEVVYRIADIDEHGLPVVKREPGMPEGAKYRHTPPAPLKVAYFDALPVWAAPNLGYWQRIEDFDEHMQEPDHG